MKWVFVLALLAGCSGTVNNDQSGYRPKQPVAFSHATHAGLFQVDCQYCHTGAETSRHAGLPAVSVCMNCHSQVKTDSPEIQKLAAAMEPDAGAAFAWLKVHRLPDHAFFSHANHVTKGVDCKSCHGEVEKMVRVEQPQRMTMGWCLDCHRATKDAAKTAPVNVTTLPPGEPSTKAVARHLTPPTDCSACHR
jgi:hypothetical protein